MNNIICNNRNFVVFLEGENDESVKIYEIRNGGKAAHPCISAKFGRFTSFEKVILPWAENEIKKFVNQ